MSYEDLMARIAREIPELAGKLSSPRVTYVRSVHKPDHVIYQAHFPGEPITPGVCILQMGVELLSEALGCPLEVAGFKNVKFLQVLSPLGTPSLTGRISGIVRDGAQVSAQCLFTTGEAVIAKMSVLCREEPKA